MLIWITIIIGEQTVRKKVNKVKQIKNLRAVSTKRLYEMIDEINNERPDIDLDNPDMMAITYTYMLDYLMLDIVNELQRRGE